MKIYSFQPMFVWDSLVELGYYHPYYLFESDYFINEDSIESWNFKTSYIWLKEQMDKKGIQFLGSNQHLIWGWYQWNGKNQMKPDKRYASVYDYYKHEPQPYVLLELEIPTERLCLTDFEAWHFVLNYFLLKNEKEIDSFSKKFNYYREKPLSDLKAHEYLQNSWQTIFDVSTSSKLLEINEEEAQIQATFYEMFYTDVIKVHFFDNKKCQKTITLNHTKNIK